MSDRIWEVDFLRGIAIAMMIVSNAVTDLQYFGAYGVNAFWFWFARITAFIFVFLVGGSLVLSHNRARKQLQGGMLPWKYVKRGLRVFSWGLLVTAFTWAFIPNDFVVFGVLHLIGASIILAYPFLQRWKLALPTGIAVIAVGIFLRGLVFNFPWLLWLGAMPQGFTTVDYFPLLPWFGVVLLGVFAGNVLSPENVPRKKFKDYTYCRFVRALNWLGRHSLFIYLVHQPVIITLLWIVGVIEPAFP